MNYKKILSIFAVSSLLLSSCDDQIMEWHEDPTHGDITRDELPLELAEKISRYEALNSYTDMTLGVGIGMALYMGDETYKALTDENFDEVTVGYAMKHAAMVNTSGEVEFDDLDAFITKTTEAGLSIFGHTLVWHSNQNASYLEGLVAATVIPGSGGSNILTNGGFDEGLDGWSYWGSGEFSQASADEALEGDGAFKIINSNDDGTQYKTQAQSTFPYVLESGKTYQISFYIRSETTGSFRISTMNNLGNYTDCHYQQDETTTSSWQYFSYEIESGGYETGLSFDIGAKAATYYIDKIEVIDKDAPVELNNLISNGDFEGATLDPWGGWGNSSTREVSADGAGFGDAGYSMVLTNPTAANLWDAQQVYWFDEALTQDQEYTCTFMVKASTSASMQIQLQSDDYSANYYGGIEVGTAWTQVSLAMTPTTADRTKFVIDFGETAATYYIDDVVFTDGESASTGPTIIEKTDEEKAEIIEAAMDDWISQMVGHCKDNVTAWDVVNEPMKESGVVRDGTDDYTAGEEPDDYFSWPLYLGEDYAVTAFNLARTYGNATDLLFINDYNLESNMTKLEGLIDYVTYIETNGATVDGIGTQMHISYTSDKDMIATMFEKLAATGKLIKVSELDVRLGTVNPTAEQMEAQAEMYQYVIDTYKELIPTDQQYGITIWGISDNEQEHEYWLPDESPNLWDADYERKHAYKGAADGLAGEDVSEGFSGDLE